jgi:YidC/Oxa1 family membrane protein insertase
MPAPGSRKQAAQFDRNGTNDMDQQRKLFIAMMISLGIILIFQMFFPPATPKRNGSPPSQTAQTQQVAPGQEAAPNAAGVPSARTAEPAAPPVPSKSREDVLAESGPRIRIDTPKLHGSIDLTGARFDDLKLADYHETVDPQSPEIVLLSPVGAANPYFVDFGWVPADPSVKLPDSATKWSISGPNETLTVQTPVTLTWDNGAGLRFTRTYSVDDDYMFTVKQTVENAGTTPVTLYPYASTTRLGMPPTSGYVALFEGLIGDFDGVLKNTKYKSLKVNEPDSATSKGAWLGFTDKYWLTALVPPQNETIQGHFSHTEMDDKLDRFQADYLDGEKIVQPGSSVAAEGRFFAGPKVVKLLQKYQNEYGVTNFVDAVDWGWFYFITKPMFYGLDYLYGLIGNFGLAIMALTVIVKGLFFPLANKSYQSMSKMKLLQPQVNELKEKFGDDKHRLNQEMMALYKRSGANPLTGCLPLFIQIPVFFSLYKVIFVTIEMRHAPFFGWIKDLSAPDPTSILTLFGLIHWSPPAAIAAFASIGAWPIIMGFTMYFQQKLNPQPADPLQAKVLMYLPLIFTYTLASFPAGLVIYWAWNNTLSAAQQWLIMRRNGAV